MYNNFKCCRFSKYLGHLTAVDGPEDSEMEEGALQCKERTVGGAVRVGCRWCCEGGV